MERCSNIERRGDGEMERWRNGELERWRWRDGYVET